MAKFCRGAEVVDAFRWTADENPTDDPEWIIDAIKSGHVTFAGAGHENVTLVIHSRNQELHAAPGDWLVRESTGEIFPCSSDAFQHDFRQPSELAMCD